MSPEISVCLDEIMIAQQRLVKAPEKHASTLRGWIRKQKESLQTLGYKGTVTRKPRTVKKPAVATKAAVAK